MTLKVVVVNTTSASRIEFSVSRITTTTATTTVLWPYDECMAVASAGPYASHLHLAPDRSPHQSNFYGPDALPAAQLTVSKH